jgi:pimeloyl-ACP methyl ester carboxylesterase
LRLAIRKLHSVYNNTHSTANSPATPPPFEVLTVNLGDQCLTLRRWSGNGPPLLLIHGISSSGLNWTSLIPALSEHFTPVAIDLRGHGSSAKPESGYLYDDYIDDLDGVLYKLGEDRPLIVGHSLGGIIALWWAARHPDKAAGIVAVDSPLHSGQDYMPAFDGWLADNTMPRDDLAIKYRNDRPEWSEDMVQRRVREMTTTARNVFVELRADSLKHDGVDRLREIEHVTSPVLFFQGDPDAGSMVHPADAVALEARLPNARVITMPGAGHSPHQQFPEAFLDKAAPFLIECAATQQGIIRSSDERS